MLIQDIKKLTQLIPGQYATCFGIISDYSNPKSSRRTGIYINVFFFKLYICIYIHFK